MLRRFVHVHHSSKCVVSPLSSAQLILSSVRLKQQQHWTSSSNLSTVQHQSQEKLRKDIDRNGDHNNNYNNNNNDVDESFVSKILLAPVDDLCRVNIPIPTFNNNNNTTTVQKSEQQQQEDDEECATSWVIITQSRDKNLVGKSVSPTIGKKYLEQFGAFGIELPSSPSSSSSSSSSAAAAAAAVIIWNFPNRCGWNSSSVRTISQEDSPLQISKSKNDNNSVKEKEVKKNPASPASIFAWAASTPPSRPPPLDAVTALSRIIFPKSSQFNLGASAIAQAPHRKKLVASMRPLLEELVSRFPKDARTHIRPKKLSGHTLELRLKAIVRANAIEFAKAEREKDLLHAMVFARCVSEDERMAAQHHLARIESYENTTLEQETRRAKAASRKRRWLKRKQRARLNIEQKVDDDDDDDDDDDEQLARLSANTEEKRNNNNNKSPLKSESNNNNNTSLYNPPAIEADFGDNLMNATELRMARKIIRDLPGIKADHVDFVIAQECKRMIIVKRWKERARGDLLFQYLMRNKYDQELLAIRKIAQDESDP